MGRASDDADDAEFICSAKRCRATARYELRWNNPGLHVPGRRKVWLACGDHRDSLSEFLSVRGFLREVHPLDADHPDAPAAGGADLMTP